jgi:hypothetical protein
LNFNTKNCRKQAEEFNKEKFKKRILEFINKCN